MADYSDFYASTYATLETDTYFLLEGAQVRQVSLTVTFAGVMLTNVIQARGEVSADSGWPTCSVFVTAKPPTGNEEDDITVVAGAGNNVTGFTGKVRRFRPSGFPKSIEMVCSGTLAYAAEWAPVLTGSTDIAYRFGVTGDFPDGSQGFFPSGGTDQDLVQFALDQVPGITYTAGNIDGTGTTLGLSAPRSFDWKNGASAWSYIQQLDRATLYRTYQARDGTIYRVQMIGHPDNTADFTLGPQDILQGASGDRNTEQTRNNLRVLGHDYGVGVGPVQGTATATPIPGVPDRWEMFSSDLIEDGNDPLGDPYSLPGLNADTLAAQILPDVDKEFVEASIPSWRDDTHGPGMTCLLDALDRLAIGEPMWVARHAWEVGDNGWIATYGLTGGGLQQTNPAPPV